MTSLTCGGIHQHQNEVTQKLHGATKMVEAKYLRFTNLSSMKNNHTMRISRSFSIPRRLSSTTRDEIQVGAGYVGFHETFIKTM
ncbi:unnamed protein product [Linum tenue]|uniref:Uncharacterized protein n=1 Tax=Linum tenue TaxID=586396 RepID=A0AAV0J5S6_9ROSI|nr:unnamed protein product [Linum tenue]